MGADDVAIELSVKDLSTGHEKRDIPANQLLPWYARDFLCAIHPDINTRVADLVTTSELRIEIPGTTTRAQLAALREASAGLVVGLPEQLLSQVETGSVLLAEPIAASLRNWSRMISWAIANEGIARDFVDLANHTKALHQFVENPLQGDAPFLPAHLRDVGFHTAVASQAFAQRLAGSYYDLCADSPEIVLEYSGGLQKTLAALYAIQWMFLETFCTTCSISDRPAAYWVIEKEGQPARSLVRARAIILSLCSSLALDPGQAAFPIVHELGHVLWNYYRDALRPREGREPPPLAVDMEVESGEFWLRPVLKDVRRWYWALAEEAASLSSGGTDVFATTLNLAEYLRTLARYFAEVFADAVAFLLVSGGDLPSYLAAVAHLLPRSDSPSGLSFRVWAIVGLAKAVAVLDWPQNANQGETLPQYLRRDGRPLRLAACLDLASSSDPPLAPPPGVAEGMKKQLDSRLAEGWKSLLQHRLTSPAIMACLEHIVGQARTLVCELDGESGTDLRKATDWLMQLGRQSTSDPSAPYLSPSVLEYLWDTAVRAMKVELPS